MHNIFYRQLVSSDYIDYRRVRLDCLKQYPDHFGSTFEEEENAKALRLSKAVREADNYNFVNGAFTPVNRLIGICGFVSDMRWKTRHRGEIIQMFVDSQFAGKGIGKRLLLLTIDKAFSDDQIEQITLGVVFTNVIALNLYTQLGFAEYGRLDKSFKSENLYFTQSFLRLTRDEWAKPSDKHG